MIRVNPPPEPTQTYTIMVGPNVKVTKDKKSGAQIANFPFEFTDGAKGLMILLRIEREPLWKPLEDIKSITINFNAKN